MCDRRHQKSRDLYGLQTGVRRFRVCRVWQRNDSVLVVGFRGIIRKVGLVGKDEAWMKMIYRIKYDEVMGDLVI